MSKLRKLSLIIFLAELVLLFLGNVYAKKVFGDMETSAYKVEVSRIAVRIKAGESLQEIDLEEYPSIRRVSVFDSKERVRGEYTVEEIGGTLYRFEYQQNEQKNVLLFINVVFLGMILSTMILLVYVDRKIFQPFSRMNRMTTQLAKGNLARPLKQEKSRYFKQFLWGIDMLREKLEGDRVRELELMKEKKTMILSLSHDIKTPLSAIELYAKAIESGLYETEEEKLAAIQGIQKNTAQMKQYVEEITKASREDILTVETVNREVYLSHVLDEISVYYGEKCQSLHIDLLIGDYQDCLIYADPDRLVEVMQNIFENAIKYGDGKRITVSCSEEEGCRLVTIANTGEAVKEEEMLSLFDSFYRGSNSGNKKGSGLGLYICKQLMHKMDGDIYAKCIEDEFRVTLVIRKL